MACPLVCFFCWLIVSSFLCFCCSCDGWSVKVSAGPVCLFFCCVFVSYFLCFCCISEGWSVAGVGLSCLFVLAGYFLVLSSVSVVVVTVDQ